MSPQELAQQTPAIWTGSPAPADDGHGGEDHGTDGGGHGAGDVTAAIALPNGSQIGEALFVDLGDGQVLVTVTVEAGSTLAAGFHGLHLHAVGKCEPNSTAPAGGAPGDFLSAGGHWQQGGEHRHGQGTGDLPALLVAGDGSATVSFSTDKFTVEELSDEDGTSVMIHVGPDNYGNIPTRYTLPDNAAVPDVTTLATGDAGGRAACGVVHGEGH